MTYASLKTEVFILAEVKTDFKLPFLYKTNTFFLHVFEVEKRLKGATRPLCQENKIYLFVFLSKKYLYRIVLMQCRGVGLGGPLR